MALLPGGLCVSLTPAKLDDIFNSDLAGADMVEVRLDYLKDPQESLQFSWTKLSIPTIAVCRREERGGCFKGTIEEELRILKAAVRNGATAVDIDHRDVQSIGEAQVIASYHDFNGTPADIERHLELACASSAQVAKVATTVQSWDDNRRLLELMARRWSKPVIVTGMGEMGQITRLIGPSRGSFLTYATTLQPSGRAAAPGQLAVREMLDVYGFRRIRRNTKLIGILGNPLEHSLSPLLHNRAFRATGLDFVYLKFPAADVKDFFDNADSIGIHGLSITIPYKRAAIQYLPVVTDAAREVGAVNTAVKSAGSWVGDNTDIDGIRAALAAMNCSPTDKRVTILGSGGAARAAVAAVRDASRIAVLSRSEKRPESWPGKVEFDLLENAGKLHCDLLINATPIGMYPKIDASPIEGPIPADVVFDMVYNPPLTALLRAAKIQGKTIIPGTTMFLAQAARQFEIWTGRTVPQGLFTPELLAS